MNDRLTFQIIHVLLVILCAWEVKIFVYYAGRKWPLQTKQSYSQPIVDESGYFRICVFFPSRTHHLSMICFSISFPYRMGYDVFFSECPGIWIPFKYGFFDLICASAPPSRRDFWEGGLLLWLQLFHIPADIEKKKNYQIHLGKPSCKKKSPNSGKLYHFFWTSKTTF